MPDLRDVGEVAERGALSWSTLVKTTSQYGFWHSVQTALLLFGMVAACYVGYHILSSGSVVDGIQVAFTTSAIEKARIEEVKKAALQQLEVEQFARNNTLTTEGLKLLLTEIPDASRARIGLIHNGTFTVNRMPLLRYDIVNSTVNPGYAPGELYKDTPLFHWGEYLSDLIAGNCKYMDIEPGPQQVTTPIVRARLEEMGTAAFFACPLTDSKGQLLGAIFVHFAHVVNEKFRQSIIDKIKKSAWQISFYMDAR